MIGIQFSEGTAEGWFGKGKASAIGSIAILLFLPLVIAFVIFAAVSANGNTSVSQSNVPPSTAPVVSAPTPVSTPTAAPAPTKVAEPGVVVLTVEELLNQIIQNPNRYKVGTIMQVTGLALDYNGAGLVEDDLFLGPKVQGFHVDVSLKKDETGKTSSYLIGKFVRSAEGFPITVRGTLRWVGKTQILIEHAYIVW